MPTILSIRRIGLEFSDLAIRRPIELPDHPLSRAPGLHQSVVLRNIAVKTGKLAAGERLEEDYPWRMAMGNMWEEFYFSLKPDYVWQPGELTVESSGGLVSMNADGLGAPHVPGYEAGLALIETKCTECKIVESADALLEKFGKNWWIYHHQARAYCHGYGPRVVVWPMLHYRGDWQGSGPVCMEYVVRFTDLEVEQTWDMIGRYVTELLKAVVDDDVPF